MATLLFLEDLQVGNCWRSPSRLITAEDVQLFARLTGDYTPLHSEPSCHGENDRPEFRTPFGRPVVHGLLGLGILAGLSSEHPRVSTLALIELGDWQFHHPIYFGETVFAETEILEIKPHGRRAGKICWHRRLRSRDERILQSGRIETIVSRREPIKLQRVIAVDRSIVTPSQVVSG